MLKKISDFAQKTIDNGENVHKALKEIVRMINNDLKDDDELKKFKLHFESLQPELFEKLKKIDKKITENDLRMCALINMGLSSKDISQLLNIKHDSVNTVRYRLRQKLSVPEEVELEEFIRELGGSVKEKVLIRL